MWYNSLRMIEAISERDVDRNLDQEWLEGHIQSTLERKSYEETAKCLGKKARETAEAILYADSNVDGRRRDISHLQVSFDEIVGALKEIVVRTVKPQRTGGYRLYDIKEELNILTGSDHVTSQLLDKMLSENVLRFNRDGNLVFAVSKLPNPRGSAESETNG